MTYIVSDIEGTLTTGSSWRGLGAYYKAKYSPLKYNLFFARWIPRYLLVSLGWMSRRAAMFDWMEDEVQLFRGFSPGAFKRMAEWVVGEVMWPKRREGVLAELEERRQDGAEIVVVSSAYQPIVDAFARRLNAIPIGSPLTFEEARLVGLQPPVNAFEFKAESIRARIGDSKILAAYGDTISDLPMLEMSQEPVAVYPDEKLEVIAKERGWRMIG
jgi:phosphoserine phosphatase